MAFLVIPGVMKSYRSKIARVFFRGLAGTQYYRKFLLPVNLSLTSQELIPRRCAATHP